MASLSRVKMIEEFYHILDQWLTLTEKGIRIDSILLKHGYHKIAVYGMGTMALHFIKALENSNVTIEYIIDPVTNYYTNIKIVADTTASDPVDAIIYTNPNENIENLQEISNRLKCDVVSLADVIFDNMK